MAARSQLSAPSAKLPAPSSPLVLSGERGEAQVSFDHATVSFFVDAADLLGVPKSVAAIYGIVFASPEPLTFADIEARLNVSKGSISQGLRVLKDVGAIKEAPSSGLTARSYLPDLELRRLVERFLENRLRKQLDEGGNRLAALREAIPSENEDAAEVLRGRLKSVQDWHRKARALLPVAKTFLKLT